MNTPLIVIAAKIIDAQERYIALLDEESTELVPLATMHGWRTSRYEQGVKLRAEIKEAMDELKAVQAALT